MIAFCITCKNRAYHLSKTLTQNIINNPGDNSKFVVLLYGESQDDPLSFLSLQKQSMKAGKLVVYSYPTDDPFHMAHAKNIAHRLGMIEGANILVNVDADNFLGKGYEDYVSEHVQKDTFLWSGIVKGQGRKLRGVSGRIAITANAFLKTGGYNEKYSTWSPDDKDFNTRLRFFGYKPIETDRKYLEAIPHGDSVRFQEYPHIRNSNWAEDMMIDPITTGIANYGNFGVGNVIHFETNNVINLAPLPTRIFGVGFHKTATTSLHSALETLGYESAHWPSGNWARDVWNEMQNIGTSPTLARTYAASDLPISVLYKELDHAYPGSKFILTIRDEEGWLRSVRDHFSDKNPFRWEWDVYPFSNKIHQVVYGRKTFDEAVFIERYRRHNAEVMNYFKTRDDLLVMNKPSWGNLCQFLGKPIPNQPYPVKFVTQRD